MSADVDVADLPLTNCVYQDEGYQNVLVLMLIPAAVAVIMILLCHENCY